MDQSDASSVDSCSSSMSDISLSSSSHSSQSQLEVPDEYFDHLDIDALIDSVTNGDVPICFDQFDDWNAQETNIENTTDESPCTVEQQTEQKILQKPPVIPKSNMDEQINSATTKQGFPNPIKCDTEKPLPESSKKLFPSKLPLKEWNILFETGSAKFVCRLCGFDYKYQATLLRHYNTHHADSMVHRCQICGQGFCLLEDLDQHNQRIACDYCPQTFSYRRGMVYHVKTVHMEMPLKCQHCEKRFVRSDQLKIHEKKKHPQNNEDAV